MQFTPPYPEKCNSNTDPGPKKLSFRFFDCAKKCGAIGKRRDKLDFFPREEFCKDVQKSIFFFSHDATKRV
jgi:hypothetical protein